MDTLARMSSLLSRQTDLVGVVFALVSFGIGVCVALVAERLGDFGGTVATVAAWAAIAAVNIARWRTTRAPS